MHEDENKRLNNH